MKVFYVFVIVGSLVFTSAQAATVSGGTLTLNINRDALAAGIDLDNTPAPSIYVEEFFDASSVSKTGVELREANTPSDLTDYAANEISATGLQFTVNGASVGPNPLGRKNSATTFAFDPNNLLGSATGSIGFSGAIRFRVDVDPPTNRVVMGDLTLEYNPAEAQKTAGSSDWVIYNYIGFTAVAYELFDVTTHLNGNVLTLDGDLGYGWGFDHLGAGPARESQARIGTFSFQTPVVPVPAAAWLFLTGVLGVGFAGRRKQSA